MPAPFIAAGVGIARALPYLQRGAKAVPGIVRAGLNYFKPYQMSSGYRASANQVIKEGINKGKKFKDVYPNLFKKGNMPRYNITSTSLPNVALQAPMYGYGAMKGYDYLTSEAEQSANTPPPIFNDGDNPEGVSPGAGNTRRGDSGKTKPEPKDDAKITSDQIKSGELDDFIKERIDLFEKYIGDDTRKRTKTAGYNAMVQFGLNLATKRGDLVEGIAESAKEPLKEFAKLGNDLMDRAASIEKAGIESGVSAYDKAKDREIDEKAIAADILQEKIKANARELDAGKFYAATYSDIMGDQDTLDTILAQNYEADGRTLKKDAVPEKQLIDAYIGQLYQSYNAVELPSGAAGDELYDSLPSGTRYFDSESGVYNTKP